MDKNTIEKQYVENFEYYKDFQKELYNFIVSLHNDHKNSIDIAEIKQRPNGEIKSLESILENLSRNDKYKDIDYIFDIKDISGVRIVCHCEDDLDHFSILLSNQLKQKYSDIRIEEKGKNNTGKSRPSYRAIHINLSKLFKINDSTYSLKGEIQLRTVMSDAWAVQDRRYIYGKDNEGEAHELTDSVSEIMKGCERLWNLVKKKSYNNENKDVDFNINLIKKQIVETISSSEIDSKKLEITEWFNKNREKSLKSFNDLNINTYMEASATLVDCKIEKQNKDLLNAARSSTIDTFGWPIGLVMDRDEFRPKPNMTGIEAEIKIQDRNLYGDDQKIPTYDFWAINRDVSFFILKSLFENSREQNKIYFNTRIVRITEVFLYLQNLYKTLGVPLNEKINFQISHCGLKNKILASSTNSRSLYKEYKILEDKVSTHKIITLHEIDSNIVDLVGFFTKPLFELFDFFELDKSVLEDIVINYKKGKIV